jgi:HlyD family secretion protein
MQVVYSNRGEVLSASTGGRVEEVTFREGDFVDKDAVLIRLATGRLDHEIIKQQQIIQTSEAELVILEQLAALEERQYQTAKAKAEAELTSTMEEVRLAQARQAMDVRLAEVELADAEHNVTEKQHLVKLGLAAANDLRLARVRMATAQEKWNKARIPIAMHTIEIRRQELARVEREYAVKRKEMAMKRRSKQGDVVAARVALATLELERNQAVIRAPRDGIITTGDVKVGDILEGGKPVVEIADQQGFRFEARVPSEEVGHLQVGMPARIKLDAYDYQQYGTVTGIVEFLSPDSGLPQGQPHAIYLVRITVESAEVGRGEFRGQVKLGMTGQVEIVTGHESLLRLLVKRIRRTISLG